MKGSVEWEYDTEEGEVFDLLIEYDYIPYTPACLTADPYYSYPAEGGYCEDMTFKVTGYRQYDENLQETLDLPTLTIEQSKELRYDEYRKRATQDLGYISTYDLEGDFDKVLENVKKEYEYYSEYLTTPHVIKENNYQGGAYLDGTEKKSVVFDRIYIDCVDTYDNGKEFRIKGERNLMPEELAVLEAKQKAEDDERVAKELEQLRWLKERYPNV